MWSTCIQNTGTGAHLHTGAVVVGQRGLCKVRHGVPVQVRRHVAHAQPPPGERRPRRAVDRRQRLRLRCKRGAPVGMRRAHVRLFPRIDVVEGQQAVLEGVRGSGAQAHALLVAVDRLHAYNHARLKVSYIPTNVRRRTAGSGLPTKHREWDMRVTSSETTTECSAVPEPDAQKARPSTAAPD